MNEQPPSKRTGILRAEIMYPGTKAQEIACALELTDETVFVVTNSLPPVGTGVLLKLSFLNTVKPVEVRAAVEQVRLSSGPGTPSGFVARFAEDDREEIRAVVARVAVGPAATPMPPVRAGLRLLIVEDNRLVRDMFSYAVTKYFAQRGGRVHLDQANDSESAWRKLNQTRYDLVLVDHFLPDGNGASLIARVRGEPTLATTCLIAISIGGDDVRRATLSAGADLFLHKPIVLKDLFYTLELLMLEGAANAGAA